MLMLVLIAYVTQVHTCFSYFSYAYVNMLVLMLMSKCEPAIMYDDRVINDRVFGHISQTRRRD